MQNNNPYSLNNQRVVILGGTSGIGLATAEAAAREGAEVIVVSSRQERVDEALTRLPENAGGYAVDLTSEAQIQEFFEKIGAFDHLVYTAGESLQLGKIGETSLEEARKAFELRFWGAYAAVKYGSSQIRPGGSIVLTSGSAGERPHPGWTVASSICGAAYSLMRALAVELAPLRVNLVSPGVVKTNLWSNMPEAERDALYRNMAEHIPTGRVGEAEDIAEAYLYLMRQPYGTGHVLVVDGGAALA